jgi:predicted PurR-regulated permease PerM
VLVAALWLLATRIANAFLVLFAAIIVAEGMRPIVDRLVTALRLPRAVAILTVYAAVIAAVSFVGWRLFQPLTLQFGAFLDALPRYTQRAQAVLSTCRRLRAHP